MRWRVKRDSPPLSFRKQKRPLVLPHPIDPGFREFAKRQLNDPVFVNFMREIGERLSEDEFERGSMPSVAPRKGPMTRAEAGKALYGKSLKTN